MQTKSIKIEIYPFVIALAGGFSLFSVIRLYVVLLLFFYLINLLVKVTKDKKSKSDIIVKSPVLQFSTINKNGDMFLPSSLTSLLTVNDIENFLKSKNKKFEITHCENGIVNICIKQYFCNIRLLQEEINEIRPLGILIVCRKYTFIEWLINIYKSKSNKI